MFPGPNWYVDSHESACENEEEYAQRYGRVVQLPTFRDRMLSGVADALRPAGQLGLLPKPVRLKRAARFGVPILFAGITLLILGFLA
jgi:hypothetical protein